MARTSKGASTRLNVAALVVAGIAVLAWEALVELSGRRFEYVPAPSAIALALVDLVRSGALLADLAHTLRVLDAQGRPTGTISRDAIDRVLRP